ncbi:hypothetical protein DV736_g5322, partial [Chaetothyriales sp. CBS 134916]
MSSSYHTKNNRTSKRGAFVNGVWHCDCDPRLPADKFQTKNGGKNHGRWFYTCQQPQHKRCPFFLWADGAKLREEGAVLSNWRTESVVPSAAPAQAPQTPKKTKQQTLLQPPITPQSRPKLMARLGATTGPRTTDASPSKPPTNLHTDSRESMDEFDWSSGNDEDMASALDMFETPRKPWTSGDGNGNGDDGDGDVFTTPATTSSRLTVHGLLSPPTAGRPVAAVGPSASTETLTLQALSLLAPHNLPTATISSLTELLSSYELQTAGIAKGRDLTRLALQQKDGKITELQSCVQGLEQERAMLKNVISLLKSDLATNTKRGPRRPRGGGMQGEGRTSEK